MVYLAKKITVSGKTDIRNLLKKRGGVPRSGRDGRQVGALK